ncbi:hypothetical protein BCV72DRAFT_320912 [Rhizopus microsporus var. microsporus]|nr:hypothetical protein BCV72DRAFT_320912 [Rhizopus microsporus var. microsporus]
MLTLVEDEAKIEKCLKKYLQGTKVLDWKYENAIREILDLGFQPYEVETDLKKLGGMYRSLIQHMKDEHWETYSKDENQKITNTIEHMEFLSTAAPIKKLLKEKKYQIGYKQSLENVVLDAREEEEYKKEKKAEEKKFDKLSPTKKFAHLAKYYGENGVLDLNTANIPKRFSKQLRNMKSECNIVLQPLVTLEEREMLIDISRCQNTADVEKLLTTWYSKYDFMSNCRFIRFALAAGLEIWNSKALTKKGHGEDWFRMHLYSNVWDKAFFDDDEFETKRSECLSQVMKVLKEIDGDTRLQRLDFILRDLNTDNDVMTAEEKPTLKGVKADIKKGEHDVLMEELEAISCQWQGTNLTIYGSRLLSSDLILTYKKGTFHIPVSVRHLPEFSKLLMAVISLKRIVKLNYTKFTLILKEKYKNEIENLVFDEEFLNEVSFISNSTDSNNGEAETDEDEKNNDDFVETTLAKIKNLKMDEKGLKKFSNWEDLLLHDRTKRRRI